MELEAFVVRRSRVLGALILLVWAANVALLSGALSFLGVLAATVGVPVGLAMVLAWIFRASLSHEPVTLVASSGRLELRKDGRARVRDGIQSGAAKLLANRRVEVRLSGLPPLFLDVEDLATARALLGALGLDRREGSSRFRVRLVHRVGGPLVAMFASVPVALACAANGHGSLALVAFVALAASPAVQAWLVRREVTVGADGIAIRGPFVDAFVSYDRITGIERIRTMGVGITVAGGERIELDTRSAQPENAPIDPVHEALVAATKRFREAPGPGAAVLASRLARGGRSVGAWLADLRASGETSGEARYRVAAVDPEALLSVVADAGADRELRVGAAVVLGATTAIAPRLRVVADDVADPLVRRIALGEEVRQEELETELSVDAARVAPGRESG